MRPQPEQNEVEQLEDRNAHIPAEWFQTTEDRIYNESARTQLRVIAAVGLTALTLFALKAPLPEKVIPKSSSELPPAPPPQAIYQGRADYIDAAHSRGIDCLGLTRPENKLQKSFQHFNYANPTHDLYDEGYYLVGQEGSGAGSKEGGYYHLKNGWMLQYNQAEDNYVVYEFKTEPGLIPITHPYSRRKVAYEQIPFVSPSEPLAIVNRRDWDKDEGMEFTDESMTFGIYKEKESFYLSIGCNTEPKSIDHRLV